MGTSKAMERRYRHWTAICAVASAAWASTALAADEAARALAASCLGCHQSPATVIPPLTGQPRALLVTKLRAFRDGTQPGTVMPQLAKGYTDAQLEAIAGYFAESERRP